MRRSLIALSSLLLACSSNVADESGAETSGSSGGGVGSSSTSGSVDPSDPGTTLPATSGGSSSGSDDSTTSSIAWETEGADEGYATTSGCGFTCPQPPGGSGGNPGFECSFTDQDCGEGERCAPWANDGGSTWNALRCVPTDANPDGLGETCQVEGSHVSGVDSCDVGLWCGPEDAVDKLELSGTCHQLCNAGPCPVGETCVVPGLGGIGVCQETCDPIDGACPGTQACMPAGFGFACHVAEPKSLEGECFAASHCAAGSVCIDAPQCGDDGESCCVPYCDLDAPDCPDGQTCADFGSPLPAHENVGYCAD